MKGWGDASWRVSLVRRKMVITLNYAEDLRERNGGTMGCLKEPCCQKEQVCEHDKGFLN